MPDHIDPPHATGAAADTVNAHSAEHSLVFHAVCPLTAVVSLTRCRIVQTAWLTLSSSCDRDGSVWVDPGRHRPELVRAADDSRSSRSCKGCGSRSKRKASTTSTRKLIRTRRYDDNRPPNKHEDADIVLLLECCRNLTFSKSTRKDSCPRSNMTTRSAAMSVRSTEGEN